MYKIITACKKNTICVMFLAFIVFCSGCGNKFFDPTQVGRFSDKPAVNIILDTLGVAEELPVAWEVGGEEPSVFDLTPVENDYTFMAGDVIRVSIYELLGQNGQYERDCVVTETGKISIPEVGVVEVINLTETQLEDEIKRILSRDILKDPLVTVTLVSSSQRTFSVLGEGVPYPGRYVKPRFDFRLTDALAMAGGPRQYNVSNIYVSRILDERQQSKNYSKQVNDGQGLKNVKPVVTGAERRIPTSLTSTNKKNQWPASKVVISSTEMVHQRNSSKLPIGFIDSRINQQKRINNGNIWQLSNMPTEPESSEGQISAQDILKRLSQRTGTVSENKSPGRIDVERNTSTYESRLSNESMMNQNVNRENSPSASTNMSNRQQSSIDSLNEGQKSQVEWVFKDGKWVSVPSNVPNITQKKTTEQGVEWIFENGKWTPVPTGSNNNIEREAQVRPNLPSTSVSQQKTAQDIGWIEPRARTRLIKIPTEELLSGNERYNIVIKPGDTIFVPVDVIGEFYIYGNVNRVGTITMTGRPMTLKQAIAAAGGLAPLAWPKRCEVVRRIGRNKEEVVSVDLDKIFNGEQPDFFIKPHDFINVGTHATARWRAILRNAFRATYGFGFVYDRNFADRDFYTSRPFSLF